MKVKLFNPSKYIVYLFIIQINKNLSILLKTKQKTVWLFESNGCFLKFIFFIILLNVFPCFINVLQINVFLIQNTLICNKQFGSIQDQSTIKVLEELAEKVK